MHGRTDAHCPDPSAAVPPGQTEKHLPILAMMLRNGEQIDSMIQSLLDAASIRAEKIISLDFKTCDLSVEVTRMIEQISLMQSNRIQFSADKSLYGDWGINGIRRMVVNLVTNAIKYSTRDTPIIINLQRRDDQAVLSVHNESREMIPVDDQEKLFQAFERTQETENSAIKGWGLGLASVKAIAKAHGGTVTFQSDKIVGTTFTLKLPIRSHA
jgi:hypothetical protein